MYFQFDSLAEFLAMGGHGLYVWIAYGTVAAVVIYLTIAVNLREKQFFQQQKRMLQRMQNHQPQADEEFVE